MKSQINQYKGHGKLIFEDNSVAAVSYAINEYQEYDGQTPTVRSRGGNVSPLEGYPAWHPITSLHPGPFTLVMEDGRKLKVLMRDLHGTVEATGEFF